jgi:hypothetical protein
VLRRRPDSAHPFGATPQRRKAHGGHLRRTNNVARICLGLKRFPIFGMSISFLGATTRIVEWVALHKGPYCWWNYDTRSAGTTPSIPCPSNTEWRWCVPASGSYHSDTGTTQPPFARPSRRHWVRPRPLMAVLESRNTNSHAWLSDTAAWSRVGITSCKKRLNPRTRFSLGPKSAP